MPQFEPEEDLVSRLADDGAGNVDTPENIAANIETEFGMIANVVTDIGDIPGTASVRPAGRFLEPGACREYLEIGGLVHSDVDGNPVPASFVYLLKYYDDILLQWIYQVYIDRDS